MVSRYVTSCRHFENKVILKALQRLRCCHYQTNNILLLCHYCEGKLVLHRRSNLVVVFNSRQSFMKLTMETAIGKQRSNVNQCLHVKNCEEQLFWKGVFIFIEITIRLLYLFNHHTYIATL